MPELRRDPPARGDEPQSEAPPRDFVEGFTASMPGSYRLQYDDQTISEHASIAWRRGAKLVHLEVWPDGATDSVCLCLVTDDRAGLLALVSSAIAAHSLDIIGANVFGRARRWQDDEAIDFFWVRGLKGRELDDIDERELEAIAATIASLLRGEVDVHSLASRTTPTSRPSGPSPCEVRFDAEAPSDLLVVDAADRPGLLSAITAAVAAAHALIVRSTVVTLAGRAHDEFLLQREGARRLSAAERDAVVRAVTAAIGSID